MELWTWYQQRNTIWIHTHEQVITTYKANIVSAEIITNPDTIVLLYSGNHYTTTIREDANDRPTSRKRTKEVCQEAPPTRRDRPAKIKTRRRKRKSEEAN